MVSDRMLVSILSVSVEPMEMSCVQAVDALAPRAGDLKAEDLLSPFHLIYPESSSAFLSFLLMSSLMTIVNHIFGNSK